MGTQRMKHFIEWRLVACCLGGITACSLHAAQVAKEPGVASLDKLDGAKCSLTNERPLLIEWSSTKRGELESALRHGTVLVTYTGCKLDVLDQCHVSTARRTGYAFVSTNPKHERHSFRTSDELYAQLPLSAAHLEGQLKSSGELQLDINMVGRYESPVSRVAANELEGDSCELATHFVQAVSVGAFRLSSSAEADESGGVNVRSVGGVHSRGHASRGFLSEEGDAKACATATSRDDRPPDRCAGLLRLRLVAVAPSDNQPVVQTKPLCPSGMGQLPNGSCVALTHHDGATEMTRWIVKEQTVFDAKTGLTWQRARAPHRLAWEQAKEYCRDLTIGEDSDWRLPKRKELVTLVVTRPAPTIDTQAFPGTPPEPFWTFMEDRSSPGDAIAIDFARGVEVSEGTGTPRAVRCVR